MGDLSETVLRFATGTYDVKRFGPTVRGADGKTDTQVPTTIPAVAVIQPATGEEMRRMPEGKRTDGLIRIHSVIELKTSGPAQEPDIITVKGVEYQVQHVDDRDSDGNYWRSFAAKAAP
jgi:hypothetical protein